MKVNKNLLFGAAALTAVLTLNASLLVNFNKKIVEIDAYDSSNLPTTIYLDDCTEQEIRSYYSGLNSLSASERKGTNLLKNLKPILMNGQKYYSYDISNGDKIWKIYEITDRDWDKSPASSTTYGTYNSNTNTITNYQYGSGKNNPYIHALYINRNIENQTLAWGNHNQDDWGINREHIWAKSHGFDSEGTNGARGDPMHLWAANGWANHEHSNNFFAFVDKTRDYSDAGSKYNTVYNNLTGYSRTVGGNQSVFEPQDCDKGDIARSIFYMVARYNNYAGEESGFDSDNPNLVLLNNLSENNRPAGTSAADDPYGMGLLSDLLAWNKLDPVDEYEIHRNNLLYRNYTNNRNPFIDFPEWADAIWGTADLDGTHYDSTTTSVANPASDPINAASTSFSISANSLDLEVGDTENISASNAEGQITWTIGDGSVVSLSKNTSSNDEEITITALAVGTTTITASNSGNDLTCEITVTDNASTYGSRNNPLTITQAKQVIDNNGGSLTPEKMYVRGVVSSNAVYSDQYSNYSEVWLQSEDGLNNHAFELYRAVLDPSILDDYSAENSLEGLEVVAYGYGKIYNTTYELAPSSGSTNKPVILSVAPVAAPKTPKELIEEENTTSTLAYRFTKTVDDHSATDIINRSFTGVAAANNYLDWSVASATSDATYVGNSAGGNDAIQLRKSSDAQAKSGIISTASGGNVGKITIDWNSNTVDGRTLNIFGKSTAYSSTDDLYGNNKGTLLGTIVKGTSTELEVSGEYAYVGFVSNSGAMYINSITIDWEGEVTTTYDYSDVSIRFGGLLSQDLWNDLDTGNHIIQGFGVMITTSSFLGANEIKDQYGSAILAESDPNIESAIVDYYMAKAEMSVPPTQGENYYWNLFYRITDFKKEYVAAAYIKTSEGYVFFEEATYSVKTLAADYIANRGYSSSAANGSLNNLANLA